MVFLAAAGILLADRIQVLAVRADEQEAHRAAAENLRLEKLLRLQDVLALGLGRQELDGPVLEKHVRRAEEIRVRRGSRVVQVAGDAGPFIQQLGLGLNLMKIAVHPQDEDQRQDQGRKSGAGASGF